MKNRIAAPSTLGVLATLVCLALTSPAAAEDRIFAGFSPEPGDAAFAYVPATVAPEEVVVVLVDRSGPLTTGVVLLTGGRTVEFSGVESRPFAVTESIVPAVVAFAEK
ncbi:hypothetical protein L6V77_00705 [Myxococcota bacterium]|nr:hypothetical protein [Myxococcota bacterium]